MKNKLLITIILLIIVFAQISAFASELTLNISANQDKIKKGDEFAVKVLWDKGMQAADFSLKYNSEKMEFVKSDLEDIYINDENGEVKTSWFSLDDTNKTEIEYIFKAKKGGKAEFSTIINGGFATGELEIPEQYIQDNLIVDVQGSNVIIIILSIIVILLLIILILKNRGKKKRAKKTR